METTTLGALLGVADAQLLVIRDHWYGMNEHAPFDAVYELRREKGGGFSGERRFSTARSGPRVVPVSVARAAAAKFFQALADAVAGPGPYQPLMTHTDDFPSIELAVHAQGEGGGGGLALLFTSSQGEFHAPWGACIGGELYTLPGEAIGRALRALHRPLKRHVLDEMIESLRHADGGGGGDESPGLDAEALRQEIFTALWMQGPLERDAAIRRCAEHLRAAGHIHYERLRSDGSLYAGLFELIETAVRSRLLDRPSRGHVRACKSDAAAYSAEDWRGALLASLDLEPIDREHAMRAAAEWARDNLGLEFRRFRLDGPIALGLRSALNSAIRRGEIVRSGRQIARAEATYLEDGPADAADVDPVEPVVVPEPPPAVVIERDTEPRSFDGKESVLVLQMGEFDSTYHLLSLATSALADVFLVEGLPKADTSWRFFLAMERPHVEGLSSWLGASKSVPAKVVDLLQHVLEGSGQTVQREYATVAQHELAPFLLVTAAGLEIPIRGPIVFDDRDLTEFRVPRIVRRPFVVDTARATADAKLLAMLLGDG